MREYRKVALGDLFGIFDRGIKMFGKIKNLITREVTNPNENSDGAITLRICSLITIIYLAVVVITLLYTKSAALILLNIVFMAVYGYLFWLTYYDMTKGALLWYNLATVGFVCFDVIYMGWDSGIQHFLFMLILLDLIFSYMSTITQCVVAVLFCMVRLFLYSYCRINEPYLDVVGVPDIFIQVFTTITVFVLLFICGMMLSKDSKEIQRKLTRYNEKLEAMANTDTLTKLWNRLHLMHYIEQKVTDSYNFMAIAIGDIDYFKKVNDTYGHECGDEVLRTLASIFKKQMEGDGVVARWGGEEFIFVFEGVNGDEAKIKLLDLQNAVRKAVIHYEESQLKVTMTFGLVEYEPSMSLDDNIKIADERLYAGKEAGRDRIIY